MLFYIFAFWCAFSTIENPINPKLNKLLNIVITFLIIIQLYWSICSSIADYNYSYAIFRELKEYVKQEKLTDYKIFSEWSTCTALLNKKTHKRHISHIADPNRIAWYSDEEFLKDYYHKDFSFLNHQHLAVCLNSYFNNHHCK